MNAIKDIKFSNTLTKGIWLPLLICFSIVAGTYISIFSLVAFALAVLAVVVLSDEDVICLVMFIMPFTNIFKSSPTSQSFFTYLKDPRSRVPKPCLADLIFFFMFCYSLLSLLSTLKSLVKSLDKYLGDFQTTIFILSPVCKFRGVAQE